MDFTQQDYAFQAGNSALQNVTDGLRKIFISDPGISLQFIMTIPVLAAAAALKVTGLQWFVIILTSLIYLVAVIFRTAAQLQTERSTSLSPFEINRIKRVGSAAVIITAGISLASYALIFIPRIIPLI